MRLLFTIDKKDYGQCTHMFARPSARSILIAGKKIAMIHSKKHDYYKFPGGGIEEGEDPIDAMIRETREEAGLVVVRDSVREYGYVHRIQKGTEDETECFVQDNYYYLAKAEGGVVSQNLDTYEAEETFALEYVDPHTAIEKNRGAGQSPARRTMLEREARVLELLIAEGMFD